jgi:hypothetical protein
MGPVKKFVGNSPWSFPAGFGKTLTLGFRRSRFNLRLPALLDKERYPYRKRER